jgi:hypothetical protein
MFNHTDVPTSFPAAVGLFDTVDLVEGGVSGTSNTPLKQLANRAAYLKDRMMAFSAVDYYDNTSSLSSTVNLAAGDTHRMVLYVVNNGTNAPILKLPAVGGIFVGYTVYIKVRHISGAIRPVKVEVNNTGTDLIAISAPGTSTGSRTSVWLHHGETLTLVWGGAAGWEILHHVGGIFRVGQPVQHYGGYTSWENPGLLLRDGSLKSRTGYARLWEYVNALNTAGNLAVTADAFWGGDPNNSMKFSTGTTGANFRIPNSVNTSLPVGDYIYF